MQGLEEILKMCQNCYRSYQSWQCRRRFPGHHQCPCNKQTVVHYSATLTFFKLNFVFIINLKIWNPRVILKTHKEATWRCRLLGLLGRWGGFGGLLTAGKGIFLSTEPGEPAGRTGERKSVFVWNNEGKMRRITNNQLSYLCSQQKAKKIVIFLRCSVNDGRRDTLWFMTSSKNLNLFEDLF